MKAEVYTTIKLNIEITKYKKVGSTCKWDLPAKAILQKSQKIITVIF